VAVRPTVETGSGGGAAATVRHQQGFTRLVSRVPHVVDIVEALAYATAQCHKEKPHR